MADEKMVDVINQGGRTYATSQGKLIPNGGISLPEAEAKKMLSYFGVVLASSVSKCAGDGAALARENAELKASVVALEAKLADFLGAQTKKELEALQEKHGAIKADEPVA